MIANDGPMLSIVLKVSKLICPWLKAMIVKACMEQELDMTQVNLFCSK